MKQILVALRFGFIALFLSITSVSWGASQLFHKAQVYNLGVSALSVTLADVNGDGKLDLLVADGGGTLGVSLGNGDGTFAAAQSYSSGGWGTYAIVVGDVDGDGHLDLIATSSCVSSDSCDHGVVSVLLGNGDGSFRAAKTFDSGGADATSVAVGAVNGDRILDIVVADNCVSSGNCSNGAVTVLLGNGDGTFQAAKSYNSGGQYSSGIALSDVNGDGKLDALISNYCAGDCVQSGNVGVLFGNGDGTFQAAKTYASDNVNSIAIADMNQDGRPDVLLPTHCAYGSACQHKGVQMMLNNGDGTFQPVQTFFSGGKSATALAVQDVSRDGKLDLIVANYCVSGNSRGGDCPRGGVVGILPGNGDGTFQTAQKYPSASSHALAIAVGDLNGDGKADLVVADGVVSVLLGAARYVTTATLISNLNPSTQGQAVTFTTTVTSAGPIPTGKVTFKDGSKTIGTVRLNGGVGTFTYSKLTVGTHPITANYRGDNDSANSTSAVLDQVVQ